MELVRLTEVDDVRRCEGLFVEYANWVGARLQDDYGIDVGRSSRSGDGPSHARATAGFEDIEILDGNEGSLSGLEGLMLFMERKLV